MSETNTPQKASFPWPAVVILVLAFIAIALLICSNRLFGEDISHQEQTDLELIVTKQKLNSAEAALLRGQYDKNQAQGQALANQAQELHDGICTNHKIPAQECDIAPNGKSVSRRAAPAKPPEAPAPATPKK